MAVGDSVSGLFGIVDCARDARLHDWVLECSEQACLFGGPMEEDVLRVAPYIVKLESGNALAERWREEGWGLAWGILCRSRLDLGNVRRHLRKFLQAELPSGQIVFFRFYDPRVWRPYWASLDDAGKAKWLAEIDEFIAEP